jgi:hypothetical protein
VISHSHRKIVENSTFSGLTTLAKNRKTSYDLNMKLAGNV